MLRFIETLLRLIKMLKVMLMLLRFVKTDPVLNETPAKTPEDRSRLIRTKT